MYGSGWHIKNRMPVPQEYDYMGPCRCGRGPHAYYRDWRGRSVHAHCIPWWEISGQNPDIDYRAELDALKEEKRHLEQRIQTLENELKES